MDAKRSCPNRRIPRPRARQCRGAQVQVADPSQEAQGKADDQACKRSGHVTAAEIHPPDSDHALAKGVAARSVRLDIVRGMGRQVDFHPQSWAHWCLVITSAYLVFAGIIQQAFPMREMSEPARNF